MRFKLSLQPALSSPKQKHLSIPFNYQYGLSSFIYNTLFKGDNAFATWLHQKGYDYEKHRYKLFTFSQLIPAKGGYIIQEDKMILNGSPVSLYISFLAKEAIEPFIIGLFNDQSFFLGTFPDVTVFKISSIEKLPEPTFKDKMTFRTLSPMAESNMMIRNDKAIAEYLSPEDQQFAPLLLQNLLRKHNAFLEKENSATLPELPEGCSMTLINKPKKKLITIKEGSSSESKIRAYLFDFALKAPVELIKTGYYAGFGENNSQGFGCAELIAKKGT